MSRYTLNVGLRTGTAAELVEITRAAFIEGLWVKEFETQSGTFVLAVDTDVCSSMYSRAFAMAARLGRNAIAVFDPHAGGYLAGPRRDLHGEFDAALFKHLSVVSA